MIEFINSLPLSTQLLLGLLAGASIVATLLIVYVLLEWAADDYWRGL